MNKLYLTGLLTVGMVGGAFADFSGWYDTPPTPPPNFGQTSITTPGVNILGSHWSLSGSGVDATVGSGGVLSGPFGLLVIQGNNNNPGETLFTIPIGAIVPSVAQPLAFNWGSSYLDAGDEVGYYINGTKTPLANHVNMLGYQSFTSGLNTGDIFGFYVTASSPAIQGHFTQARLDLYNFTYPVPEVSTILANGLMLSALGGIVIYRKKQSAKKVV